MKSVNHQKNDGHEAKQIQPKTVQWVPAVGRCGLPVKLLRRSSGFSDATFFQLAHQGRRHASLQGQPAGRTGVRKCQAQAPVGRSPHGHASAQESSRREARTPQAPATLTRSLEQSDIPAERCQVAPSGRIRIAPLNGFGLHRVVPLYTSVLRPVDVVEGGGFGHNNLTMLVLPTL